jgi:hypothetical protein
VAASDTGPVVGGALGWEVTPRLALEGVASWLDRAEAPESFSAALRVRTGLMRQRSAPFLEGGFGLYRAGIDPGRASIPDFYRRRMVFGDAAHRQTFTDPAFLVGGGWTLFVSRHFSLQPAVEATIVTRDAHGYVLTAGVVRLGYHFEDHPVTP